MILPSRAVVPTRLVWLSAASAFAIGAIVIYATAPRLRIAMRWGSLAALPFALTEPLFIERYWTPPTLFDLARRTRFDLESIVFCAGIGGLAAVLYDVATGRTPEPPPRRLIDDRRRRYHEGALGVPACVFVVLLLSTGAPLMAGVVTFVLIAAGRVVLLPELAPKTCVGGGVFAIGYVAVLWAVRTIAPSYIADVWSAGVWRYGTLLGLPVTEIAFGLAFGVAWSGLYEQLVWTLAPAPPTAVPVPPSPPPA